MENEIITEMARRLFQESVLENWKFYALVILLSFVGSVIAK